MNTPPVHEVWSQSVESASHVSSDERHVVARVDHQPVAEPVDALVGDEVARAHLVARAQPPRHARELLLGHSRERALEDAVVVARPAHRRAVGEGRPDVAVVVGERRRRRSRARFGGSTRNRWGRSRSSRRRPRAPASAPRCRRDCRTPARSTRCSALQSASFVSSGSNAAATDTGLDAADVTTYAGDRLDLVVRQRPPNAGMPRPPRVPDARRGRRSGFSASRLGPAVPVEPAAERAWQPPQPASAKTAAPVSDGELGRRGSPPPEQPARPSATRAKASVERRAARLQGTHGQVLVMKCCQAPSGYEELFSEKQAERDARSYRRKGLGRPARWIVDVVREQGSRARPCSSPAAASAPIQIELLKAGAARSTVVELSPGYEEVAADLAREAGVAERIERHVGDFAADGTEPADVVVLHRVVCCYPDYERLLTAAATKARQTLVYTYPPRNVGSRAAMALLNIWPWLKRLRVSRVRPSASGDGGRRPSARLRAVRAPAPRHLARRRAGAQ